MQAQSVRQHVPAQAERRACRSDASFNRTRAAQNPATALQTVDVDPSSRKASGPWFVTPMGLPFCLLLARRPTVDNVHGAGARQGA